ncbi:MAG: hypothetical protein IPM45_13300 [Acidimicrobiales bacterium]|nr:hypothetical protein [Acidimicrobiales bacterium]
MELAVYPEDDLIGARAGAGYEEAQAREPAFWEDPVGGTRLMDLLWKRYAGRIDRISLEGWALDYFAGDRISAAYEFLALQDGPQEE